MTAHQLVLILAVLLAGAEAILHRSLLAGAVGFLALAQLL